MKEQVQLFVYAAKAIPQQIKSANAIRGVCKKIAAAQNVTLPSDPEPESVRTLDGLNNVAERKEV